MGRRHASNRTTSTTCTFFGLQAFQLLLWLTFTIQIDSARGPVFVATLPPPTATFDRTLTSVADVSELVIHLVNGPSPPLATRSSRLRAESSPALAALIRVRVEAAVMARNSGSLYHPSMHVSV